MSRGIVGSVGYLNARPLTDGIDRSAWEVVSDVPSAIADALHGGRVDIALVPVAAILGGGDWRIVPGVCIGAHGPVDSVLLVAETPPEQWTEVVLDGESRTSAILARLLLGRGPLSRRAPADLAIRPIPAGEGRDRARGTTAALVIGDAALDLPERLVHRIDLAEQWTAWTGLPFVFAVWAGRPGIDPALVAHLRMVGQQGVAAIDATWTGPERDYLAERIRFALDDAAQMGLRRFAALALADGLIASEHLELYGPSDAAIPRPEGLDALLGSAVDGARLGFDEALRLEVAAPLTELAAAADLKRALHGDGLVGYRLGWRGEADPIAVEAAIEAGAVEVHVPAGAQTETLADRWPDVRFVAGEPVETVLVVGAGESGADRVRAILAVRDSGADAVRVVAADQPGKPAASEANTAVDHLRAVALTRLLLDGVRVEASAETEGIGMAQASLRAGCDHLGTIFPTEPLDRWAEAVEEIERQIREAGFEPARERRIRRASLGRGDVAAVP